MDTQRARSARKGLRLLVLAVAAGVGVAGCHGTPTDQFSDKLITRTDKFFDVAHTTGTTFVIVGYNGRILRSEDAGETWAEVESPAQWSLNQVEFIDDYGWAVGHYGTIIHSRDAGKTWTQQQSSTEKTIFAVSFTDKLHGRASGDQSTFLSTDNGGETWEARRIAVSQVGLTPDMSLAVPDIIYYGIHFFDEQNGWMVGEYGNIRHTSDGGQTWDSQHGSLLNGLRTAGVMAADVMSLSAFFRVHFSDLNHGHIMGGGGAIASTNDGGQNWTWISREGQFNKDVPAMPIYDFVQPSQNGKLLAVGTNGLVLNSEDNGASWQPSTTKADIFTWLNGVDITDEGKGVIVGGKGTILLTSDYGKTWRPIQEQ